MDPRKKRKTLRELRVTVSRIKKQGKKVVLANGCFDLLHVGHLRYLQGAKKQGDFLVVAINNDVSARKLKGPGHPLMRIQDRVALVSALSCVDYVTVFGGYTVKNVLLSLRPNIHAKGGDYTLDNVPERDVVRSYEGRVAIVGGPKIQSTSQLIKRIKNL